MKCRIVLNFFLTSSIFRLSHIDTLCLTYFLWIISFRSEIVRDAWERGNLCTSLLSWLLELYIAFHYLRLILCDLPFISQTHGICFIPPFRKLWESYVEYVFVSEEFSLFLSKDRLFRLNSISTNGRSQLQR